MLYFTQKTALLLESSHECHCSWVIGLKEGGVKAAVEGVYDDYTKRSEYTSYLVKSQQKFQDARLQVGAVQTAVNR